MLSGWGKADSGNDKNKDEDEDLYVTIDAVTCALTSQGVLLAFRGNLSFVGEILMASLSNGSDALVAYLPEWRRHIYIRTFFWAVSVERFIFCVV